MRWIRRISARQKLGIGLFVFGVGLTIVLAFVGGASQPPSQATDAVLVLVIAVTQGGAAWAFNGVGRADPSHATRSASRLIWLAGRANSAGGKAQSAFEDTVDPSELKQVLGIVATDLSWIEDGLVQSLDDWRVFHEQAVGDAEGDENGND